jgi:cysteine desulfurase
MDKIYLDDVATSRVAPEVLKAMEPFFLEEYGNPSSLHAKGENAEKAINSAREKLAAEINCKPHEIIFTSGATESNNVALKSFWKPGKKRIIISSIEHPSIMETADFLENAGVEVLEIGLDKECKLNLEKLEKSITENTLMVSIIHANNIFGVVQKLEAIGKICKKHNVLFHTDAAQSFGKVGIDVRKMNISALSASAHKLGGPKGIGLLFVKEGLEVEPLIHGGGQERGIRSGTENVPGTVGFAKALELTKKVDNKRIVKIRDKLIEGLKEIGGKINSSSDGLFNIVNVSFPGIDAEGLVYRLSGRGIYVSAGSACDSKKEKEDYVLKAIGLSDEEIKGSIRISLNEGISEKDVKRVVGKIRDSVEKLRV